MSDEILTNIAALKAVFETNFGGIPGRKVTMTEFKELTPEERQDLGDQCRAALS